MIRTRSIARTLSSVVRTWKPVWLVVAALGVFAPQASAQTNLSLYVANLGATPGSQVLIVAPGGGSSTVLGVTDPRGIAFDAAGTVYISRLTSSSIFKQDVNGNVTILTPSGVTNPHGIVFGGGQLYVNNNVANGRTYTVNPNTGASDIFAIGLDAPTGIARDAAGNIYVGTQAGTNQIIKYNSVGVFQGAFDGVSSARELEFDAAGNLLIADAAAGAVKRIDAATLALNTGTASVFINTGANSTPRGVEFDENGNLYVSLANDMTAGTGVINRYNGATGAFISTYVSGLSNPDYIEFNPIPVPEPATVMAVGAAGLGLLGLARRVRRKVKPTAAV